MGVFTLFLIALGLSMDAFAVSISDGLCYPQAGRKQAFLTALVFGVFQAGMPMIGYFAGRTFAGAISSLDHWIALVLLGFIGGKMLIEAIRELREPESCPARKFSFQLLLMQGVATSIDALAVGVSFAVMDVNIFYAAGFIGVTTFLCSFVGFFLGRIFGGRWGQKAEILGGLILIGIGLKIFIEHTFA